MDSQGGLGNIPDALKQELLGLVNGAKQDSAEFISKQGQELELTLSQLAAGQITQDEFEVATRDIQRATRIFALDQQIAVKIEVRERATKLALGIGQVVLEQLVKQLKTAGPTPRGPTIL